VRRDTAARARRSPARRGYTNHEMCTDDNNPCCYADGLLVAPVADCPLAHTHIGVNPTLRPDWSAPGNRALDTDSDPNDDNKLWFFSLPPAHAAGTPGWPNWSNADGSTFLLASPEAGPGGTPVIHPTDPAKQLYTCRFMWSKANGYGDSLGTQHLDGGTRRTARTACEPGERRSANHARVEPTVEAGRHQPGPSRTSSWKCPAACPS
jgi:hypothetical protein